MGLLKRILGVIVGVATLALALVFSAVIFAFLLAAGAVLGGYLWWKSRAAGAGAQDVLHGSPRSPERGRVIEAEVREVPAEALEERRTPPGSN